MAHQRRSEIFLFIFLPIDLKWEVGRTFSSGGSKGKTV